MKKTKQSALSRRNGAPSTMGGALSTGRRALPRRLDGSILVGKQWS